MRKPSALAGYLFIIALTWASAASAADVVLSGAVKSTAGEALGGVTVSAKADGATITTTVFTDEAGRYYFPTLPAAKYRLWAQALGRPAELRSGRQVGPGHEAEPGERARVAQVAARLSEGLPEPRARLAGDRLQEAVDLREVVFLAGAHPPA